jgi:twinkle protein
MDETTLIRHEACPHCGSSDANALYTDGHHYCFSCETYTKETGEVDTMQSAEVLEFNENVHYKPILGEVQALSKRKLSLKTVQKWDYQVGSYHGNSVQIANYKDGKGVTVAQKIRFPNKDFKFLGDTKKAGLYGQHLWGEGGKMVTVVEGELDALSLSQAFDNRWPVVSISKGAAGAKRDISQAIDWLEKFETVIFMFDNDEHGKKAAEDCAMLLTPGKAKVASLPLKDASEMLVAGRVKEMVDAVWQAKTFRPDGIVAGTDLWDLVSTEEQVESCPYPFMGLNEKTLGIRVGEIVTVTAGSGIGKSQLTREIAYDLIKQGQTVGYIALEESVKRTSLGLMGLSINKPLHLGISDVSKEELKQAYDNTIGSGRVYLYDHWGSTDSDNLLAKIRYLVRGCGCNHIILDHLSIVVSGMGEGDERRLIDNTMTKLRTLTEELQCGMILVSHLKRPEGKGHEEGAATSLAQLRGSAAIAQLSDMVIGLERNQQDKENPNLTTIRVLKNRWTGETGIACHLAYSKETGRMTETIFDDEDQQEVEF